MSEFLLPFRGSCGIQIPRPIFKMEVAEEKEELSEIEQAALDYIVKGPKDSFQARKEEMIVHIEEELRNVDN